MEHFEYCYLVFRAHEVLRLHEKARAEGEEFHVTNAFTPLKCRLLAQAVIRNINPGEDNVIILRLRHPDDDKDWVPTVAAAQANFFGPGYTIVPGVVREAGLVEHLAYSTKIPEAIKPPTQT